MILYRKIPALVFSLLAIAAGSSHAQVLNRTVSVDAEFRSDAVAISRVAFAGAPIECGIPYSATAATPVFPFSAGPDWLTQLTIYVQNRTDKTIVYTELSLNFPETGDGRTPQTPQTRVPLRLGYYPAAVAYFGTGQQMPQVSRPLLNWEPGKTIALTISSEVFGEIQTNLSSRLPAPANATKVVIRREAAIFSDNTRWVSHGFSVPDPQRPGRWRPITDLNYFPGHMVWPIVFKADTAVQLQPVAR